MVPIEGSSVAEGLNISEPLYLEHVQREEEGARMEFPATGMPSRPMPPEMGAGLYEAVSARASERLSDGRLDSHYVSADQGGCAISSASSHEQVFAEILSYPLSGFFQWEVRPLCDWQQSYETLISLYNCLEG